MKKIVRWQTLNQSEIDGGNISKVCIVPLLTTRRLSNAGTVR